MISQHKEPSCNRAVNHYRYIIRAQSTRSDNSMGSAQSGKTVTSLDDAINGTNRIASCHSGQYDEYYECRTAAHAGSWYSDDHEHLRTTLDRYLHQVPTPYPLSTSKSRLRAMICPHAGYSYSGPTAAYSYNALLQELIRSNGTTTDGHIADGGTAVQQIIVLHPSHHVPLRGKCAISGARIIATPLGPLHVDTTLREELLRLSSSDKKYSFTIMTQEQDENEHSGEMQYPYIAHVLQKAEAMLMAKHNNDVPTIRQITVTPIMCGSLTTADEIAYGALLMEILHRPNVCTIVSTDFCHWGRRFGYQPTSFATNDPSQHQASSSSSSTTVSSTTTTVPIYEIIQQLDRRGMDLIEAKEPGAFASYLRETNNTICGRHAVSVWLHAMTTRARTTSTGSAESVTTEGAVDHHVSMTSTNATTMLPFQQCTVQFIYYDQSSQSKTMSDSSVSYAAGIATLPML